MTLNPVVRAISAAIYVVVVAYLINTIGSGNSVDGPIIPEVYMAILMLSLFVLSVAAMGYAFLLEPLLLCFEGKPREGAIYFVKTLVTFGVIVVGLVFVALFLR